jgi:glucose-6-phosphate isomerase
MASITLDLKYATPFLSEGELERMEPATTAAAALLESRKGPGAAYTGWLALPRQYDKAAFKRIKAAAREIRKSSDVLVVIGIGGSYLGARAAMEFCLHSFYNHVDKKMRNKTPEVYFVGTSLSATYLQHVVDVIGSRDYSVVVISKSGTTTEPAIAFRLFKQLLEEKYGPEKARQRIYAITDKAKGALKTLATREGYETFIVPDDVGGRFSVLTAVGLLPIAAAGIDIDELMHGAADAMKAFSAPFGRNGCLQYAAMRHILHRKGKEIELMVGYEPRLQALSEWWKQLFGESEGKEGKGIFPAAAQFTTDLHSLGQYVQDGRRILFETMLELSRPSIDLVVAPDDADLDGLNYLAGKSLDYINKKAAEGTLQAHTAGGVPNIIIRVPEATPYWLGQLFYFFEKSCAVSGYLLGVNPFDQPGVEDYKQHMFRLLGKV